MTTMTTDYEALEEQRPDALPTLYADRDCRGLAQRVWAFEDWIEQFGHFDSIRLTHAWLPPMSTQMNRKPVEHCQIEYLHAALHCHHHRWDEEGACYCVGQTAYRGCCQYCDWEGEIRAESHEAWMDSADHAWPGWRELPLAPRPPGQIGTAKKAEQAKAAWIAKVNALYPPGWIEQGGPIRTVRGVGQTGAYSHGHPFGGYDLPGAMDYTDCSLSRGKNRCPGLEGCIAENWTCEREEWL